MLRELTEYGNNIKEEMKVTLSEIKKNLQGTNNREVDNQIQNNDLEHKEKIGIQPEQREEKGIQKKGGWYKESLGHLQMYQYLNHKGGRRRTRRARN